MKKLTWLLKQRKSNMRTMEGIEYPQNSLLGLPLEILRKIIQNLSTDDWLTLCKCCKILQQIVNKFFLYNQVIIRDKVKLKRFLKTISRNKKKNILSLYVKSIEFEHPLKESTHTETTSIAGFEYSKIEVAVTESYISKMLEIINQLPNLTEIKLAEISPGFQFPESFSSLKTFAHEHNYYPSIRQLTISSEKSWSIALRPNLLWPFGLIEKLVLCDMVIDSNSLLKHRLLTLVNGDGPLLIKGREPNSIICWSPVKQLKLSSCSVVSNASRGLPQYFQEVECLELDSLRFHYDILLSHYFPNLKNLSIDLNSKCFSLYDSNESRSINAGNTNSNYAYYNSMFVPKFYLNYEKFADSIEKIPTKIKSLTFTNVSFTNLKPVNIEDVNDENYNLVNLNLYKFLKLLSGYTHVEFIMLKNYRLHQSRTREDWFNLLHPSFSPMNSVRVKDKDGSILFTTNEKY